jgi:hypothetical protein
VALWGTLSALLLTAGLATASAGLTELSGLASEESLTLLAFAPELDFRGLMLAAVVIGALGVLDDVTITQVSAIWELRRSDPTSGGRQLYAAGIRIGRDHIASTVNTLVLAYTAAALPLLLLFTQSGLSLGQMITSETVAVEVVQTLVGSIGLIASVPMTTALACWVVTRSADQPEDQGERRPRGPRPRPGGQHAPDGLAIRRHDAVVPDWEPPVPDPRIGHMPGTSRGGVPPPGPRTSDGWTSQGPGPSEGWASQGPDTADAWRRQDAAPSETWTAPEPREPGPWEPRPGTATPGWPGEGDGSPETWSSPGPATPRGAGTPGTWPRQPGGPTGTGRLPRVPTGEEPGPPGATSWDAPRGPHDPARGRRPYRRTDPQPTDPPPDEPW